MRFGYQLRAASGREFVFLTEIKSPDLLKFIEKEMRNDAEAIQYEIREGKLYFDHLKKVFHGDLKWMSAIDYIRQKRMKPADCEGVVDGLYYLSVDDEKKMRRNRYLVLSLNLVQAVIFVVYIPFFYSLGISVFQFFSRIQG